MNTGLLLMVVSLVLGVATAASEGVWFRVGVALQLALVIWAFVRWWRARAAYLSARDAYLKAREGWRA